MFAMRGARLATATGLDVRDGIDVLYHWAFEPAGAVVTLKVLAERPALALKAVANVLPGANWIERELHDLLGANFRDHPDMRRLLLDDSWPEGVHPLRKSFDQIKDRPPLPPNQSPPDVDPKAGRRGRS
jgi:NADH-quinone oxidoreductase subunit C